MTTEVPEYRALLELCWDVMIRDARKALDYALEAQGMIEPVSDEMCECISYQGLCHIYMGSFSSAELLLKTALSLATKHGLTNKLKLIHNSLGLCYQKLGQYLAAYEHFEFCYDLEKDKTEGSMLVAASMNMAIVLFDMGRVEDAEHLLNTVLGYDLSDVVPDNLAEVYHLQAQVFLKHLAFDDADTALSAAESLAKQANYQALLIQCQIMRGRMARLQGRLEDSETILAALTQSESLENDGIDGVLAYIERAKNLFSLGRVDQASELLQASLIRFRLPDQSPQLQEVLEALARGYHMAEDYRQEAKTLGHLLRLHRSAEMAQARNLLEMREFKRKKEDAARQEQLKVLENDILKSRQQQLNLLNDIAHQITQALDFNQLGKRLFDILQSHFDVHFISLLTLNADQETLEFRFIIEKGELIEASDIALTESSSYSVEAITKGVPVLVNEQEIRENVQFVGNKTDMPNTMLFIPLFLETERLGVFSIQSTMKDRFSIDEKAFVVAISKFIAIAVSNIVSHEQVKALNETLMYEKQQIELAQEKIRFLAYHDSLTELPNRQFLEKEVEHRVSVEDTHFCLIYIDLDGFKQVNDQYGHRTGDQVLVEVGRRISEMIGDNDCAARIGGDEFVILIDGNLGAQGQQDLVTSLAQSIERPILTKNGDMHISASIGCACFPVQGDNLDTLMHTADQAMYQVKRSNKAQR